MYPDAVTAMLEGVDPSAQEVIETIEARQPASSRDTAAGEGRLGTRSRQPDGRVQRGERSQAWSSISRVTDIVGGERAFAAQSTDGREAQEFGFANLAPRCVATRRIRPRAAIARTHLARQLRPLAIVREAALRQLYRASSYLVTGKAESATFDAATVPAMVYEQRRLS